jgi:hypothetical protein
METSDSYAKLYNELNFERQAYIRYRRFEMNTLEARNLPALAVESVNVLVHRKKEKRRWKI